MSVVTYREDLLPTRRLQFSEVRKKNQSQNDTMGSKYFLIIFPCGNFKHIFQFHDTTLKD